MAMRMTMSDELEDRTNPIFNFITKKVFQQEEKADKVVEKVKAKERKAEIASEKVTSHEARTMERFLHSNQLPHDEGMYPHLIERGLMQVVTYQGQRIYGLTEKGVESIRIK